MQRYYYAKKITFTMIEIKNIKKSNDMLCYNNKSKFDVW